MEHTRGRRFHVVTVVVSPENVRNGACSCKHTPVPARRVSLASPRSHSLSSFYRVQAGSHIDLRKRNAAFQSRTGKTNPLKTQDPLEKKPLPRWLVWTFLVLIVGGFGASLARPSLVRGDS